jgi:hypothetical protein
MTVVQIDKPENANLADGSPSYAHGSMLTIVALCYSPKQGR